MFNLMQKVKEKKSGGEKCDRNEVRDNDRTQRIHVI